MAAGKVRERREKEEREERKEIKAKPKNKTLFTKAVNENLQNYSPSPKNSLSLLQKERGLYRPPQGMKIPKTLRTWLSYRTIK